MVTVRRPLEEEVEPREVEAMLTLLLISLSSFLHKSQFNSKECRLDVVLTEISPFSDSNPTQCCLSLLFPISYSWPMLFLFLLLEILIHTSLSLSNCFYSKYRSHEVWEHTTANISFPPPLRPFSYRNLEFFFIKICFFYI